MTDTDPTVPYSAGTARPRIAMPANACDCHMHLFDDAFPLVANAVLKPLPASIADYRKLQRRLGLTRQVIVQPSPYGLDNRLLLRELQAIGPTARGVAVVDDTVQRDALDELHRAGVRGTRFNLVQAGATHADMLEEVARRIAPLGWHLQLHMKPADFIASIDRIAALPVPVVFDHMARFATEPALQPQVQDGLRRLLAHGRTWLKLSGAYLASGRGEPYDDIAPFVEELARDFPERLVWGSDWPHVTEAPSYPDDATLADLLLRWMPDAALREQVLVANPARLYGF